MEKPDLRVMWLSAEVPDPFREEPVSMVLVDLGLDRGCATVMAAVDGAASLSSATEAASSGPGSIRLRPRPAAPWSICAQAAKNMKPTGSCPMPKPGQWAFNVRTPSGWRRFVAPETDLTNERHPAHPLFAATHELIGSIRMASP